MFPVTPLYKDFDTLIIIGGDISADVSFFEDGTLTIYTADGENKGNAEIVFP